MKKLLFLGIDTSTADALAYAKAKGVYTIITDYLEKNSSPLKAEADECWQINVTDLDALEQRCREKRVSGIFAGNHELCLDCCKLLCKRLGLPFYASDEGWRAARDKELYHEHCRKIGLDVPRTYWIGGNPPEGAFEGIRFPVAVKPIDGSAKRGFAVVNSMEALQPAIQHALAYSSRKKIIVEEHIDGNQVSVFCCILNGRLKLIDVMIDLPVEVNGKNNSGFGIHYSTHNAVIEKNLIPAYESLIREMDCRQGAIVFQSILRDRTYYQLEMGYRLDGICSWRHIERMTGFNQLKYMVDLALGEATVDRLSEEDGNTGKEICACVGFGSRPGRVCSIQGKQELLSRPDVVVQCDRFHEGDVIPDANDITAITMIIEIFGIDHHEIGEKLKEINRMIHYYDEEGKDLLIYHDGLFEKWKSLQRTAKA